MGSQPTALSREEVDNLVELTYLKKHEINTLYKKFAKMAPELIERNKYARLPKEIILTLPELQVNPFKEEIAKVFSSHEDGSMNFEDYVGMMSVFNSRAPKSIKMEYAFRIYDFDEDGAISKSDLEILIDKLIGSSDLILNKCDKEMLIEKVLIEADLDNDQKIVYGEFEQIIAKTPDFVNTFKLHI